MALASKSAAETEGPIVAVYPQVLATSSLMLRARQVEHAGGLEELRRTLELASRSAVSAGAEEPMASVEMSRGPSSRVEYLRFLPDGRTVVTAGNGTIRFWDVVAGTPPSPIPQKPIEHFAFSGDGRTLATIQPETTDIELWDVRTRQRLTIIQNAFPKGSSCSFSLNPDGVTLATSSYEGDTALGIQLWDVPSGVRRTDVQMQLPSRARLKATGEWPFYRLLYFKPDGTLFGAVGGSFGSYRMRTWDAASGKPVDFIQTEHYSYDLPVFSPDGRTLALSDREYIEIFDDKAKYPQRITYAHHRETLGLSYYEDLRTLAFSPDGRILATSLGSHSTVILWGPRPLTIHTPEPHYGVLRFSPDGRLLAMADEKRGVVRLWHLSSERFRPKLHSAGGLFAFSPDSRTLATVRDNGTIQSWDLTKARPGRQRRGEFDIELEDTQPASPPLVMTTVIPEGLSHPFTPVEASPPLGSFVERFITPRLWLRCATAAIRDAVRVSIAEAVKAQTPLGIHEEMFIVTLQDDEEFTFRPAPTHRVLITDVPVPLGEHPTIVRVPPTELHVPDLLQRVLARWRPQAAVGRVFRVERDGDFLAFYVARSSPNTTGLEENLRGYPGILAVLAEAMQGSGVVVLPRDVLASRAGLEALVQQAPPVLRARLLIYDPAVETMYNLAARLRAHPAADRVGVLGAPAVASGLEAILPVSTAVIPLTPAALVTELLRFVGVPDAVLDQLHTVGLEEAFA